MKRKIIKQGHNTLTITLPNEWAKKLNLKAGDEIEISESENSLIINGQFNNPHQCCVIDIANFTVPLLWRYFQSAYRAGCEEIKVIFDPHKNQYEDPFHFYTTQFDYANFGEEIKPKTALAMIQEVIGRFVGMEVIESGNGFCIIREMAEITPKEFENSLRRIFLVILELFDRTIEALQNNEIKDPSLCKEIHSTDLIIDKFVDYCARILNRTVGIIPERKKQLVFSSLFILELIGDEFKYIAKHLALSKKPLKECIPTLELVKEHFEEYYKLYYKFDKKLSVKFGEKDVEVYRHNFKTKEKFKGEERSVARHIMMISKFTLALAELRIQMEF